MILFAFIAGRPFSDTFYTTDALGKVKEGRNTELSYELKSIISLTKSGGHI